MSDRISTFTIGANSSPKDTQIAYSHQLDDGATCIQLDQVLTSGDLLRLLETHRGFQHWPELLQMIAMHHAASGAVHEQIINTTADSSVLSAIATSGIATRTTLAQLAKSNSESVREHAKLALLSLSLNSADPATFEQLLAAHAGSSLDDATIRALVAAHQDAPSYILKRLENDPINFVRETAVARLAFRGT